MPERIALVVLGNSATPYLDIKMNGKEYTIRCDEKGIHVVCLQGVSVELQDIFRGTWVILK